MNKAIHIADTVHGSIRMTSIEKEVLSTSIFNRLHNISQNSTAYLTFPTNKTKRFEHSIGTMHLCGDMFYSSVANSNNDTLTDFFDEIEKSIDNVIQTKILDNNNIEKYKKRIGDIFLSNQNAWHKYKTIPIDDQYNALIPINVEEKNRMFYVIVLQSVRLSALLHDVGHPPFSHITENALKNIWSRVKAVGEEMRTARQIEYFEIINKYFDGKHELHEEIGNEITEKVLDDIIPTIAQEVETEKIDKIYYENFFRIILKEITTTILNSKWQQDVHNIFADIHRLIDGSLDGDRLDYVCRDPLNSGLNMGRIEYDRLINNMCFIKSDKGNYLVGLPTKIIDTVDDFFDRRWNLYKRIIYHHRVIKTDYLLECCIEDLSWEYLTENAETETYEGIALPYDISGLWKAVKNQLSDRYFSYSLIQWDDNWLMTVLKKEYFTTYIKQKNIVHFRLEELISNNKKYFSLIKRANDFLEIDNTIADFLREKKIICKIIKSKHKLLKDQEVKPNALTNKTLKVDIAKPLLTKLKDISGFLTKYNSEKVLEDGFLLPKLLCITETFIVAEEMLCIISQTKAKIVKDNNQINDLIVVSKKVKTGVEEGTAIYDVHGKIESFSHLSKKGIDLFKERDFFPTYYLYVLKIHNEDTVDYSSIKKQFGTIIITEIVDRMEKYFFGV